MTSCMRSYCDLIALRMLLLLLLLVRSDSADNRCLSSLISTCEDCLRRGPECAWCSQEKFLDGAHVSQRCGSVSDLRVRGCEEAFIESPNVKVEVNATISSSQVSPREINIHLRPGGEAMFVIEVQQLERYPVDLYYLVDVSASMQDNLDRLKTAGLALSHQMKEHSSDFRVGFGSFVDKPVSPYIDVHPSKLLNPCSDYEVHCRPAHGYIHVLPVTQNMTEFTRVIQEQRISGNMDTPEGGFDAMLQAAVCQKDIGWRPEAKHLLLVMTDQPSHLALDGKLAGIVVPHDGRCHLEDSIYSQTTTMEHPTIAQLAEKLLENSVYSIFAVDQVQYQWYEDLLDLIPGSYVGRLFPKASNLKDLIVHAYKKLLSDVEVQIGLEDAQAQRFRVNVTAFCPNGSTVSGSTKCSSVQPRQTEILHAMKVHGHGQCVSGECVCLPGWTGETCDCPVSTESCVSDDGLICSGWGKCVCGKCVCDDSRRSGALCEKCPICDSSCQSHWSCVNCHLSNGLGSDAYQLCNRSCAASSVEYVDDITELVRGKYCLYPSSEKCQHRFLMDLASERPQLHISRHPVCVWSRRYFKTFLSAFLLTVTLGIGMLAAVRQLLRARNCSWQSNPEQQFERSPKDSSYIPTTNEKTIPYRSDGLPNQPVEMHSHMPKMPLSHAWQ
ncbi:integrin beta-6-like [Sinocyclocheilus grahami]|uniref:integrin beta-6-like n=1 Tax=Sinocyclocheilus grahami TaxID=75366 RepID=UPI0007ACEE2A|nr:PREDICTED: integrin beta-6-like [Sinocyclocheilus grahami]